MLADTNVTDAGWNPGGTGCRPSAEIVAGAAGVVVVLADETGAETDADTDAATDGEPPAVGVVEAL
ncbi:MAG: hypothetical protein ACRDV3_07825 [Acidothermaceae bacterium]